MKDYILRLTSGTTYKLYDGTTLVSDTDLTTLFATAGGAYLSFDFDGGTPTATDELTITNSLDTAVITNTGLTDAIEENKNYKATWSANATAFDTFEVLEGVAMDESQLSFLMGKIKNAGGPTPLPDGTKLWTLPMGVYQLGVGTYHFSETISKTIPGPTASKMLVIQQIGTLNSKETRKFWISSSGSGSISGKTNQDWLYGFMYADGSESSNPDSSAFLGQGPFVNIASNLTTSTSDQALGASQGRYLNHKILGIGANSSSDAVFPWTSIGTGSSYTRRAQHVDLNISETGLSIPADTWTSLGITMPEGFRPDATIIGAITANNNGTFEAGLVKVNTNGTVEVHTSGATTDIYGSIVYAIGDIY